MTGADRLARALGPEVVTRLLERVEDPAARTLECVFSLGPVRNAGRRAVHLVLKETTEVTGEGDLGESLQ
jgi:hypothetical protein